MARHCFPTTVKRSQRRFHFFDHTLRMNRYPGRKLVKLQTRPLGEFDQLKRCISDFSMDTEKMVRDSVFQREMKGRCGFEHYRAAPIFDTPPYQSASLFSCPPTSYIFTTEILRTFLVVALPFVTTAGAH